MLLINYKADSEMKTKQNKYITMVSENTAGAQAKIFLMLGHRSFKVGRTEE